MEVSFSPILIVGCERSGTTLLSALLARHDQVAIPPETFFFSDVFFQGFWKRPSLSHENLLKAALAGRVGEFGLDAQLLLKDFRTRPCSMPALFQCILENYAKRWQKSQCGEKCILHVFFVPLLKAWFPDARFIGIARDGRDVVRSMMRQPWHPNKLRAKASNWRMKSELLLKYERDYPEHFKLLRYEKLVTDPEATLRELDAYLGLDFEGGQLDPTVRQGVFLKREIGHKGKVSEAVDASRAFAWKDEKRAGELNAMNAIMGETLEHLGYERQPISGNMAQRAWEGFLAQVWIRFFELLVYSRGLILYDKIRYFWRRRAMHLSGNDALGGL